MVRGPLRTLLALHAAAIAAAAAVLLLALGLPLLARGALGPRAFVLVVVAAAILAAGLGAVLLWRGVARPVDRMLEAARRLGARGDALPLLGEGGGPALSRAAIAFERLAGALEEERRRLADKVDELTRADRALGDARETLVRSERLATVGRLAAGLAHEVGNPLGAISGYVEIARARLPAGADPDLHDAVARIAEAATRIDATIRGLLDFARPSPSSIVPLDLAPVLEATVRLARVQSRFRHVEVTLALPPTLPRVLADERQLSQVLLNVLLNAGDAMAGEGRVTVSAAAHGEMVEVALADQGPGVAPDHLPRLFDPFFTTKDPGEGTGLGLAISHRIAESLGGALSAENAPGGGAVFRLRLRAAEDPDGLLPSHRI